MRDDEMAAREVNVTLEVRRGCWETETLEFCKTLALSLYGDAGRR